jgi:hypothetical protein
MKALVKTLFVARGDIYHPNTLVDIDECQQEMIYALKMKWMEVVENVPIETEAPGDGENGERAEDGKGGFGRRAKRRPRTTRTADDGVS